MEKEKIILLHGLFGSKSNLKGIALRLENKFETHCIDLPNHADGEKINSFDHKKMASSLISKLEKLDSPFHILGHSLGGKIAIQIAHDRPELISKLIVADIAPKIYPRHHDHILKGLNEIPIKTIRDRSEADNYLKSHIENKVLRQFLLKSLKKEKDGFKWNFNLEVITNKYDEIADTPQINTLINQNTLFIRGELSNYIQEKDYALIRSKFYRYTIETIKGTGHWLHAEKPEIFSELVENFLKLKE